MNIELFRYLTVAQVEQNAITGREISDKSNGLKPKALFGGDYYLSINRFLQLLVLGLPTMLMLA